MKKNKETKAAEKKKKKQPMNKKRLNNKILKAKEIIALNREALKKNSDIPELPKIPRWKRVLHIVKRVIFWTLIAVLAAAIVSFVMIRVKGGTPTVFGYSVQRVTSGSMEPTLMVGDIILSKDVDDPSEIEVGDIITFKGDFSFDFNNVTHRVLIAPQKNILGEYVLTTQGDANKTVDPEIKFADVQSKMVKKLDFLNRLFEFFMSPWGLLVFIGALILIFFDELLTLAKVLTGNYKDDEEDENFSEIMKRIKAEEEEQKRLEEERRAYKRDNPRKFDSTSNKKKRARKQQAKKAKAEEASQKPRRTENAKDPKRAKGSKNDKYASYSKKKR